MQKYTHKNYQIARDTDGEIVTDKPTLWHCAGARSFRVLWLLEELEAEYDLVLLKFPPRYLEEDYKKINSLGTVPYFVSGKSRMTESSGICHFLASTMNGGEAFLVENTNDCYADFINWMYMSDATLTFPQTVMLRYSVLEAEEDRRPEVVQHYREWFLARLTRLDDYLQKSGAQYLCEDRFTIADIAIGYALLLGSSDWLKISSDYPDAVKNYLKTLQERPAFARAIKAEQ